MLKVPFAGEDHGHVAVDGLMATKAIKSALNNIIFKIIRLNSYFQSATLSPSGIHGNLL